MDDARKKLYDKAQGIAENLIGSGPGAAAIAALKAKNGDLIQTKSEQLKDQVIRDKNGNLWVKKTREDSVNINGQVKMSRSDISAGRARVRRDACTFNLFGVEIDAAQYHRTRKEYEKAFIFICIGGGHRSPGSGRAGVAGMVQCIQAGVCRKQRH